MTDTHETLKQIENNLAEARKLLAERDIIDRKLSSLLNIPPAATGLSVGTLPEIMTSHIEQHGPSKTSDLAQAALDAGYPTKSRNKTMFVAVISAALDEDSGRRFVRTTNQPRGNLWGLVSKHKPAAGWKPKKPKRK